MLYRLLADATELTFEQITGPPSSAQVPDASDVLVACPMHERLLLKVEAA